MSQNNPKTFIRFNKSVVNLHVGNVYTNNYISVKNRNKT